MLKIAPNGSIQVSIDHLMEDRPTTFKGVVERYRNLDITLFHHIVSSPTCRYEKKFGEGRVPESVLAMTPRKRLKAILKAGAIQGKPCIHPDVQKEYVMGAQTGDYRCTRCGRRVEPEDENRSIPEQRQ
ncbi:MAG: hypothetical protein JWO38_8118 [Gemmataceae bacterium]|nr:hypothetical protein [Gemmataceae bacterium]